MCHSFPVLVVRRPHGDLVTFGADVDHGAADLVAVVVEGLAHQAQELLRFDQITMCRNVVTWSSRIVTTVPISPAPKFPKSPHI